MMKLDPRIGSENFLRMLDPQNANSWPRDAPEFVFLARAFDQIGRAKYGEHWDERFEIEPWPEAVIAKREEFAERYERWLEEDEEDERRDDQEQSDEDRTDRQLFHKFVILTFREEEDRAAFGARYGELRNKLAGEIADQLELGNLVAAARPKISGAFNDLESHNWSGENRVDLVFRCSIAHRWIFVRRNSLENYLQGLASSNFGNLEGDQHASAGGQPVTQSVGGHSRGLKSRAAKTAAVQEAARAIWPDGIPTSLPGKIRDTVIRDWIRENVHTDMNVSLTTIRRVVNCDAGNPRKD